MNRALLVGAAAAAAGTYFLMGEMSAEASGSSSDNSDESDSQGSGGGSSPSSPTPDRQGVRVTDIYDHVDESEFRGPIPTVPDPEPDDSEPYDTRDRMREIDGGVGVV